MFEAFDLMHGASGIIRQAGKPVTGSGPRVIRLNPLYPAHNLDSPFLFNQITMKLGAYLDYSHGQYECTLCERYFGNEAALYDHCRQTSRHAWCERCSRVFLSGSAKDAHLRESNVHHICSSCPQLLDFETDNDLEDHLVECHHYCPNCDICCDSKKQLEEHDVEKHCLCLKCGEFFQNKNNLQMVQ
jgi:hypothetical protein